MTEREVDLNPWVPELEDGAPVSARVGRLEQMAEEYYHASLASADLTETVKELNTTAAGVRGNLAELHKAKTYLNRVYLIAVATVLLVLIGGLVAYIALTSQQLEAASFQRSVVERCEQREQQSRTVRAFVDLEIDRLRTSSLPPAQERESIASLKELREGFAAEDCDALE